MKAEIFYYLKFAAAEFAVWLVCCTFYILYRLRKDHD